MTNPEAFIKWICEVPKSSYEVLAELEREGINLSYQVLMQKIGVLVAKGELDKIKRMDKKIVYHHIPKPKLNQEEEIKNE